MKANIETEFSFDNMLQSGLLSSVSNETELATAESESSSSSYRNGERDNVSISVEQYQNDIKNVITSDDFEDGVLSLSEEYIESIFTDESCEDIKTALMNLYLGNLSNSHLLTGILRMIGCIPYKKAVPQCPIMALGLLQNKDIYIRDRAIQVFERWNSKEGIPVLKSLNCDQKWLQRYVDKVILYLEEEGID